MNNLPDPKEFKNFTMKLDKSIKFDSVVKSYDIHSIYNKIKANVVPAGLVSQMIDINILKQCTNAQNVLKEFIGYDKYNKSICIFLLDDNRNIVTIAIQKSKNKDGDIVKWKTLGLKSFIKYKIKDDFVFIVYGMKEILLCELLDISYLGLQADSIAKGLHRNEQFQNEIKSKLENKYIILLLDNDKSCNDTIQPIEQELNQVVKMIIPIQMQDLWTNHIISNGGKDRTIPINYDFTDFVNDVKTVSQIENNLKDILKWSINNEF